MGSNNTKWNVQIGIEKVQQTVQYITTCSFNLPTDDNKVRENGYTQHITWIFSLPSDGMNGEVMIRGAALAWIPCEVSVIKGHSLQLSRSHADVNSCHWNPERVCSQTPRNLR